jgi:hypothetical protein
LFLLALILLFTGYPFLGRILLVVALPLCHIILFFSC